MAQIDDLLKSLGLGNSYQGPGIDNGLQSPPSQPAPIKNVTNSSLANSIDNEMSDDMLHEEGMNLFPDKSKEEVSKGIADIKESHPDYSNDAILQAAKQAKEKLANQYSSDARQNLVESQKPQGFDVAAFIGGLGSSLAGRGSSGADEIINARNERNKQALSNFDVGRKQAGEDVAAGADREKVLREQDPNSPESKMAQELATKFGMNPDIVKNLTADKFKSLSPAMEKLYQVEENNKTRREQNTERAFQRQLAMGNKQSQEKDRALMQTQQLLESARGNPAVAQAEKDLQSSSKARGLINMFGDHPDQLNNGQIRLLAQEIGKIASGGVPTQHELEGIAPSTLMGKMAGVVETFTNSPTPANAGKFVQQYKDYIDHLDKTSQKIIEDKYGRVIESRKSQLGEEGYKNLKANYLDRFKNANSESSQSQPSSNKPSWAR